tara:strand:- start:2813 stop:3544 length:732 start_codon:yes stop_codon:yes gene_type:complete
MVKLSLLFLVLLVTTTYAQIGPDGTGTVNGYTIGPGADLYGANLTGADLSGADLHFAYLQEAILSGADLTGANLRNANLTFANLSGADLSGADLTGALLRYTYLSEAILSGADLTGADLTSTDLTGTIWTAVISQSDFAAVVAQRNAAIAEKASAEAERDARPTQVAYDTVVAERDAKLTLDEVKDLRAGSTMIAVENGTATLSMEVVQSDDLEIWTSGGTTDLQIPVDANSDTKFFRFKMTE